MNTLFSSTKNFELTLFEIKQLPQLKNYLPIFVNELVSKAYKQTGTAYDFQLRDPSYQNLLKTH
jgi:hypothetical protein